MLVVKMTVNCAYSNCIRTLVDLHTEVDTNVQIVGVEALSTLLVDNSKKFEKSC